jgi:hypothetical protein
MNKNLIALILMCAFVTPVMAEKPEWAGKGKPTEEQKAAHKAAMEAEEDIDDSDDRMKEKKEKKEKSSELKGIEKQSVKKSEQPQKELDKVSDKGKESRGENSKKWWKFWGEKT